MSQLPSWTLGFSPPDLSPPLALPQKRRVQVSYVHVDSTSMLIRNQPYIWPLKRYCRTKVLHFLLNTSQYYTQTPRFAQTQNSVNTKEFCTTSNNGKAFMFNYVARVLTRTCCSYISYGINHTVMRVSFGVSRRYRNPPTPWNNWPYSHYGFLYIRFQEDIKVIVVVVVIIIILVIFACPDARCEPGKPQGLAATLSYIIGVMITYYWWKKTLINSYRCYFNRFERSVVSTAPIWFNPLRTCWCWRSLVKYVEGVRWRTTCWWRPDPWDPWVRGGVGRWCRYKAGENVLEIRGRWVKWMENGWEMDRRVANLPRFLLNIWNPNMNCQGFVLQISCVNVNCASVWK